MGREFEPPMWMGGVWYNNRDVFEYVITSTVF